MTRPRPRGSLLRHEQQDCHGDRGRSSTFGELGEMPVLRPGGPSGSRTHEAATGGPSAGEGRDCVDDCLADETRKGRGRSADRETRVRTWC